MSEILSMNIDKVDMSVFIERQVDVHACRAVAQSLREYGAVLVRDPRVDEDDSTKFLNMMERYFSQPREVKMKDARPQFFYQVGVTPDFVERPRDNSTIAHELDTAERPASNPSARRKDPKWRFFWRCGERPKTTDFPELNALQVVPAAFKDEWASTMNGWGGRLINTILMFSDMLALGLGLPQTSIRDKLELGPHLLAPTGSDLNVLADSVGTTLAGYHYDLNILTIHGKSRYPGLYIWTRTGKRIPVVVPEGYLLIQSGIQLEYLTAGDIRRGMHEVVVSKETSEAAREARSAGGSLWRVSSTLFAHVRSDASLAPLGFYGKNADPTLYPSVQAGVQVANELKAIELAS